MNATTKGSTKHTKSPRRRAREFALQGLYQWRVGGADFAAIESQLPELEGFARADHDFCFTLVRGVLAQQEALIAAVSTCIDRPFRELSPIEACILLSGAYELTHLPETPYRVIINECIELAKSFGGSEGHRYVNGVLDRLAATLRADEVSSRRPA
jgi:transcription antitermination protein NusB